MSIRDKWHLHPRHVIPGIDDVYDTIPEKPIIKIAHSIDGGKTWPTLEMKKGATVLAAALFIMEDHPEKCCHPLRTDFYRVYSAEDRSLLDDSTTLKHGAMIIFKHLPCGHPQCQTLAPSKKVPQ